MEPGSGGVDPDRWVQLEEWRIGLLAAPAVSAADAEVMREVVRWGLAELLRGLTSQGVTVSLSR